MDPSKRKLKPPWFNHKRFKRSHVNRMQLDNQGNHNTIVEDNKIKIQDRRDITATDNISFNFEQARENVRKDDSVTNNNNFEELFVKFISRIEEPISQTVKKCSLIIRGLEQEMRAAGIRFQYIEPFGSSVTGLAMEDSDIDIFVHFRNPDQRSLYLIRNQLYRSRNFNNIEFIGRAKVPIIKCLHVPTGTMCDISASSPSGCVNTQLIKLYFNMDPNIRCLVLFLKYWLKCHFIHGTGKIVTYALNWLVIFYLQTLHLLPTVKLLQDCAVNKVHIKTWDYSFCESVYGIYHGYISNFYSVLLGFFKFYSEFNYQQHVISPYIGEIILVSKFRQTESLPSAFNQYKNLVIRNIVRPFETGHYFFLQDPFEHNNNIVYQASYGTLGAFKEWCSVAIHILSTSAASNSVLDRLISNTESKGTSVDIKFSQLPDVSIDKDGFQMVFQSFRYICEHVYMLEFNYNEADFINKTSGPDFPECIIHIKCKTKVDVSSDRSKFKMKKWRQKGKFSFFIDMEIEKSRKCAIYLKDESNISILFSSIPSMQKITVRICGSIGFNDHFGKTCTHLINRAIEKLYPAANGGNKKENIESDEDTSDELEIIEDNMLKTIVSVDPDKIENASGQKNIPLDEDTSDDIKIIEHDMIKTVIDKSSNKIENQEIYNESKNNNFQIIDKNYENTKSAEELFNDNKNFITPDDEDEIQIINVVENKKQKTKYTDDDDDDIQVINTIINIRIPKIAFCAKFEPPAQSVQELSRRMTNIYLHKCEGRGDSCPLGKPKKLNGYNVMKRNKIKKQ